MGFDSEQFKKNWQRREKEAATKMEGHRQHAVNTKPSSRLKVTTTSANAFRTGGAEEGESIIAELSKLSRFEYALHRKDAAKQLGITVATLDKAVAEHRAQIEEEDAGLPHWQVVPWSTCVDGAELLEAIKQMFCRYIVLPNGASDALALWVLHSWTADAGDVSPFLVLVSPTRRCGKTNTLIILLYLTPCSELASNISASALFRYIEDKRPTLLIDEADSFLNGNDEMRGVLNSGHTKAAAYVIRNVEINGEHKPRRFSTWAPKAIATIRELADTLADRAVIIQLQRKPRTACVSRLRRRDNAEFKELRSKAARWAADNFSRLTDPDPMIPEALGDRAADNWRPLLAIADLAGGPWPVRGREAAKHLSGEEQESSEINVGLLADIRVAFGSRDVISSADLVAKLVADPERPWAEWRRARPLTQRQLAGLLKPFGIISVTVYRPGLADAKGYRRIDFEGAWERYCPGQTSSSRPLRSANASERRNAHEMGKTNDFSSVGTSFSDGSKSGALSNKDAGSDVSTHRNTQKDGDTDSSHGVHLPPGAIELPDASIWLRPSGGGEPPAISAGPEDHLPDIIK